LLAVADAKARLELARRIARTGMTVRQVERLAARQPKAPASAAVPALDPNTKAALEELQRKFGTRVILHADRPGHPGQLAFEYYNTADLARLYEQLMRQ
jgi:hypothetical protein